MQSAHLEKIFYHYIDTRPEIEESVLSRFYDNPEIKLAHDIRKEFRKKYSKAPTSSQMKQICRLKSLQEQLSDEKIDALYEINLGEYDPDWMESTAESWIEYKTLDTSVIDLVSYLKTTKISAENVKEVVQTAKSLISDRNNVDFKFDEGSDFFDPESHRQRVHERFSTGYAYLDTVLGGGYSPKTLIALAGAPKIGKCFHGSVKVNFRNKRTGEIVSMPIQEFHEMTMQKFLADPANISLIYSQNQVSDESKKSADH